MAGAFWTLMRTAATGAILASTLQAASAVEPLSAASDQPAPTVYTQKSDAAAAGPMLAKARAAGKIRVIAGLSLSIKPGLAGDAAAAQGQALDAAQSGVALRALGSASGEDVVKFSTIPYVSLIVTPDQLAKLLKDPSVVSVQEDVAVPPTLAQSVPLINGDDVVAKGFTGAGRVVAILDTGVQSNHPMLAGKVVSEACYSTTSAPNAATSVCPGGAASSTAVGSGLPCPSTIEGCYHGTHVASIAAGKSTSLAGVAPGAQVVAVQVFSKFTGASACNGASTCVKSFTTDQIKALERVLALKSSFKIDAVNMSLGGGQFAGYCDTTNPAETAAINNLRAAGVATAIASGNDSFTGYISSPSCITSAIRVGATTKTDGIAYYSNHSQLVDLLAPGSSITAALPVANYGALSGTSMATPHVAGSFALLRSAKPDASVSDILGALNCTGKQIAARETGGTTYSKPRIDLLAALTVLGVKQKSDNWSFKKEKDAKDWIPLLGKWKVQDGFYQSSSKGSAAAATLNCSPSVKIQATVSRVMKDISTNFGNTGVLYKATIAADGTTNGYFAGYNSCVADTAGTCVGGPGKPGIGFLYRINNFNLQTGTAYVTRLCQVKAAIKADKDNDIEITSTPSQQTYKLNGKTVCSVADASSAAGGVAILSFSTSGKSKALKIDEAKLTVNKADAPLADEGAGNDAEALPPVASAPASQTTTKGSVADMAAVAQ